ncbi:MAG: response regulator [Lachnospiraceae bacterium]|nr:response regulator [Lachnospiraceae bacterium]
MRYWFMERDEAKKTILIVDDNKLNIVTARDVLKDDYLLIEAQSAKEAFEILERKIPDLIILDIVMPEMDGYEMIKKLKASRRFKKIPVIFLTAETDPESEVKGFDLGAVDFIIKPFIAPVMKRRVKTQLELLSYEYSLLEMVEKKIEENDKLQYLLSAGFAELVESRDGVTGGHIKNTLIYFEAFVNYLKYIPAYRDYITDEFITLSVRSAPLHDIGKIGIDDVVLRKQSSLEAGEMRYMQTHAELGGETFHKIRKIFPENEFLKIAEHMARYHHERWDGTGYPSGLKGEQIPLEARIMSVVDVYDALTSERPYKKPFSHEKSMGIIVEGRGTQFDPALVDCFVDCSSIIKDCLLHKDERRKQLL